MLALLISPVLKQLAATSVCTTPDPGTSNSTCKGHSAHPSCQTCPRPCPIPQLTMLLSLHVPVCHHEPGQPHCLSAWHTRPTLPSSGSCREPSLAPCNAIHWATRGPASPHAQCPVQCTKFNAKSSTSSLDSAGDLGGRSLVSAKSAKPGGSEPQLLAAILPITRTGLPWRTQQSRVKVRERLWGNIRALGSKAGYS